MNNSFRYEIELKRPGKLVHISPYSANEETFGYEMNWVAPAAGHLFTSNNCEQAGGVHVNVPEAAEPRMKNITAED